MVKALIGVVVVILMVSCIDQRLYLKRIKSTEVLNISGVYLNKGDIENHDSKYCDVILFYDNSIIIRGLISKDQLNDNFEGAINEFHRLAKNSKTSFGVYQVDNEDICLEFWSPSTGGGLRTTINKGKIIDKESFMLNYMRSNYDGKSREVNTLFKLFPLKNKPDSINRFIK